MTTGTRTTGSIAAVVGGVVGAGGGIWVALAVSDQLAVGDLSDIGRGLVLLLAGMIIGPSVGTTCALALARQERALATGLLTGPFVIATTLSAFAILAVIPLPRSAVRLIGQPMVIMFGVAGIWAARWITTRSASRTGPRDADDDRRRT